jgi:methyl-accepting chemotaxis protein
VQHDPTSLGLLGISGIGKGHRTVDTYVHMVSSTLPDSAEVATAHLDRVVSWLRDVAATRDLSSAVPRFPDVDPAVIQTLADFLAGLRGEMSAFRAVVDSAADTAALNARQLETIVANTMEQSSVVQRAAAAVAEIDRGAAHVAATAEELRTITASVTDATGSYDRGIAVVLEALTLLTKTVAGASTSAIQMEHRAIGIVAFLEQLRRIARQARLLGINAAIEAAHLGEAGAGFVIVAEEVKKLASSTSESAQEVHRIEKQIHETSEQVHAAIGESEAIARELVNDVELARDQSLQTGQQVRDLAEAIADVAVIATGQSDKLSVIAEGISQSAAYAQNVVDIARRASRLDLAGSLEQLRQAIGKYRLGNREHVKAVTADISILPPIVLDAANIVRAQVDTDQRELLSLITKLAVAIARNGYEWREIVTSLASLHTQLETSTHQIEETAEGARNAAARSHRMRVALDAMRAGFASSVEGLERSLQRVVRVRDTVQHAEASVMSTAAATERANEILELIDTISSETILLSFNAAIEAAHAGEAGSGFGVIADEIRKLADTTFSSTQEIASILGGLAEASASTTETTTMAVSQTETVHDETVRMQATVTDLRSQLEQTVGRSSQVASIVEQQLAALSDASAAVEIALARVESDSASATDSRRLELANLGMRAHALAGTRPLGTVADTMRRIGFDIATQMDTAYDNAIAKSPVTLNDFFDTNYIEITGAAIAEFGRLFNVSRVPSAGFDPAKFATKYDRYVEADLNTLIDSGVPEHPAIKAMFVVDLNGFCIAHYRECRQDWTGDYVTDLNNNRIKRFFDDGLSLRCSRVGLGELGETIPRRSPYSAFRDRGCKLTREATRPWAIYTYARDTGVVYNDLSVAIYAQAQRIATIRIVYDADVL